MRLDDIFQTVYHLLHSDKRFKKMQKNTRCHSSCAAPLSKLLLKREESRKVFNMAKLRLIHSFSMVYYMPRSDKRLKNYSENSTEKSLRAVFSDAKFISLCNAVLWLKKVQCLRVEHAVRKC